VACGWAVGAGGITLAGYALGQPSLARIFAFGSFQPPVTAVGFALAGVSLALVAPRRMGRVRRSFGTALGLVVALLGVTLLGERLGDLGTGIDLVFFPDQVRDWATAETPGRPSAYTAIAFVAVGLSLALLEADKDHRHRPARVLVPVVALLASVAVCGYLYGVDYLRGTGTVDGLAPATIVTLAVLAAGLVASRPERPPAGAFTGGGLGAVTMRRLVPVGTAVLLGAVVVTAIGRFLPSIGEGLAVTAVTGLTVVALYVVFWRAGAALDDASGAQRQSVAELRDERDFIQTVLQTLGDGVLVADLDGTVRRVNPSWCEITGYPASTAVGARPPYLWRPPEQMADWPAELAEVLATESSVDRDILVRRPNGTDREVRVTGMSVHDHTGVRMLVFTYRDRTEGNQAQTDRRRAGEQLDQFFDLSGDLMCVADSAGRLTRLNPAWEHTLGYPVEELLDRDFRELIHPDDVADEGAEVRSAPGTVTRVFDNRYRHRDDSYRWLTWNATTTLDDGLTYAVGRDTTMTKRAEANERASEERAQQAQRMASLGQLAGGVAHDFNNLLGIILNYTAFAAEQAADKGDADIEADLTQIRAAAERAVGLTGQLLTFTRQDTIRPERLDVNVSIAETQAMLARTIGAHIEMIAVLSPTPLMIYADAGHIQQILVNLAVNARDAMPDGGTLAIEASAADLDAAQPNLQPVPKAGRYVRLLVSDTGTGMSPEVVARIFEPFYTTKPTGQGTGLGLATVYGIIAAAGGSINVYSEPDLGTTFRVYFPLADAIDEPEIAARPPDTGSAPSGHGQTVLVVEDEPALGRSVARILGGGGYRVLSADDGAQALELYAEHGCDLLLTDIVMPEMSGRRLADLLHQQRPELPVLYMSGYTNGLLGSARILDEGIAFIEKPFTAHHLLTQVNGVFAAVVTD
jgi:PAS domain S-box-containing protein